MTSLNWPVAAREDISAQGSLSRPGWYAYGGKVGRCPVTNTSKSFTNITISLVWTSSFKVGHSY